MLGCAKRTDGRRSREEKKVNLKGKKVQLTIQGPHCIHLTEAKSCR